MPIPHSKPIELEYPEATGSLCLKILYINVFICWLWAIVNIHWEL